jgi:TIR domain
MAIDVFMSYSRDDRVKAQTLAQLLESCGWSVWWDRDLDAGEHWQPAVLDNVAAAKCVLVIWSRDSVNKDWVKREAQVGLERNTLVPVFMQPAGLTTPTEQVQGVRLSTWDGDQRSEALIPLLEAVKRKVGYGSIPDRTNFDFEERLQQDIKIITVSEVAEAVFAYCAAAIEWERLRQAGHQFRDEDHEPKRQTYDRVKSLFNRPGSELDEEDFHEIVRPFLDALYPDYERLGTNAAIRLES